MARTFSAKFTAGEDVLGKLKKLLRELQDKKKLWYMPWCIIGEMMIKHAKDGFSRGKIVSTFDNLGIDLRKFVKNTERLPNAPKIEANDIAKGLAEFVLPDNNVIKLSAVIDNPDRMFTDIINDRRAPMQPFLEQLMKKLELKPKGGK